MTATSQPPTGEDPALTALTRELYWAQDRASRSRMDTAQLRDRLHETLLRLRKDETLLMPLGEGTLASPSPWRRKLKMVLFRVMRPISWRYDRLVADQAELSLGLAERLMAAEAELARLRGTEPPAGDPEGSAHP